MDSNHFKNLYLAELSLLLDWSTRLFFVFKGILFHCSLVGPSGLEPPTSCLSGTRSNLLSYEPMWLVWIFSHLNFLPSLSRKLLCLPFFSKKVSGGDEEIRLSRELRAQSFAALTIINRHSLPLLLRILRSFKFFALKNKRDTFVSLGAPWRIRTFDLPVRSRALYPLS